jgi:predicted patatin/cPLA2 family phospholipase
MSVSTELNKREVTPSRRGLVLAGGGAKGAWQFGVLQALHEAEITFDAVSGTSVGALNGAIWCANLMDVGDRMWSSMSLSRVFAIRPWLAVFAAFGLPMRIFRAAYYGYPPDENKLGRVLYIACSALMFAALLSLVLAFYLPWAFYDNHGNIQLLRGAPVLFYIGVFAYVIGSYTLNSNRAIGRNGFIILGSIFLFLSLGIVLTAHALGYPLPFAEILLIAFGIVPMLMLIIASSSMYLNVSLFSAAPLESTVRQVIESGFTTPLFATEATEISSYYDPDDIKYFWEFGSDVSFRSYAPASKTALMPQYVRVDLEDRGEAFEALLASSALPLGIVASRRTKEGKRAIDGGVADNVPWFPLVDTFECDELFIVHCSPMRDWDDGLQRAAWKKADRLKRVVSAQIPKPETLNFDASISRDVPTDIPFRDAPRWPSRVVVIAPAKPLGNFVTGTLNFSHHASIQRLKNGYLTGRTKAAAYLTEKQINSSPRSASPQDGSGVAEYPYKRA